MVRAELPDHSSDSRSLPTQQLMGTSWQPVMAPLRKLEVVREGTGHPTSLCQRLRIGTLSDRHSQRAESYMGLPFTFYLYQYDVMSLIHVSIAYNVVWCMLR